MIIGIDMGHTISGHNYGAVGMIKESEETRRLGALVIKYLQQLGHTVVNCTVDKATSNSTSLNERVKKANAQKLDLLASIHFNAGGGKGAEVLTCNGKYIVQADRVLKNMEAIGFRNRGIKDGTSPRRLAVVNSTKALSMLIEVCFVDTQSDVDLYRNSIEKVAVAIAEGITGQKVSSNQPIKADSNSPIAPAMQKEINSLKGLFNMKQDGIATEELVSRLPNLTGVEQRGCVRIMQRILIMKGFLSVKSDTGIIGPANVAAINRFKESVGIPNSKILIDRQTWRKLLEY